jgi:signal peptidase I
MPSGRSSSPSRKVLLAGAALAAVAAIAIVILVSRGRNTADTRSYSVPSESMAPAFKLGDKVTVDLDAYDGGEPALGDVVLLHPPNGAASAECGVRIRGLQPIETGEACPKPTAGRSRELFLKRVVAVGGDTVAIKEGQAVVDGTVQNEKSFTKPCGAAYECNLPKTIKIPPGYVFLLGDNRGLSDDSRYWGPVPTASIVGRVEG